MPEPRPGPAEGRTSAVVPAAFLVSGLANLAFLKYISVSLGAADFGAVIGSHALMAALSLMALGLQAVCAAEVTLGRSQGVAATFVAAADRVTLRAAGVAIALGVALFLIGPVAGVLHLPSRSFAAAIPLLAGTSLLLAVASGSVLGLGRDRAFAALVVMEPVLRCVLAPLLAALGVGPFSPVLALLLSTTTAVIVARRLMPHAAPAAAAEPRTRRPRTGPLHRLRSPSALLALGCFGLLAFGDVILVRFFLQPADAGLYAGVAVVSRFLLLLPFPLALLLLVRVRARMRKIQRTWPELLRVLAMLLVLVVGSLLLIDQFSARILGVFLDPETFGSMRDQYPRYAMAAAGFGIAQIVLVYGLAAGTVSLAVLPLVTVAMEVVLLREVGANGASIANCISVVQTVSLLFFGVLCGVVFAALFWARRMRLP